MTVVPQQRGRAVVRVIDGPYAIDDKAEEGMKTVLLIVKRGSAVNVVEVVPVD